VVRRCVAEAEREVSGWTSRYIQRVLRLSCPRHACPPPSPAYLSAQKLLFCNVGVSYKPHPFVSFISLFLSVFQALHFLADMSSPSCIPVFDAHPNHQDRLDRFQGWSNDKANTSPTQLAAGSIPSPPFPSTNLPSLDIYSFDQWTPLLDMDFSSNPYLGSCLDITVSDPSFSCGSQDSVSSSPNSSYVTLTLLLTPCTV
jgi:hypothetical protein